MDEQHHQREQQQSSMATFFFQDEITSIFNQHHLHHHVGGLDSGFTSFDFPSGFMDLLGSGGGGGGAMTFQDFYLSQPLPSLFDLIQPSPPRLQLPRIEEEENRLEKELPGMRAGEVAVGDRVPATPNSSSISCSSNEVGREENEAGEGKGDSVAGIEEEDGKDKTKKLCSDSLKPKKQNQKRQRESRFAFMTKSEVDHLDDGFRWRKYGQKAVKNSPYPRSYFRCTTARCGVKKMVERSSDDPSIVVTTYEGQHTHSSPVTPRGSIGMVLPLPPQSETLTVGYNNGGFASAKFPSVIPQSPQKQYQGIQPYLYRSGTDPTFPSLRRGDGTCWAETVFTTVDKEDGLLTSSLADPPRLGCKVKGESDLPA